MKPTFWQLRNRLKYVEKLRTGVYEELHFGWFTGYGKARCAVGAGVVGNIRDFHFPCGATGNVNHPLNYINGYEKKGRLEFSDHYGFNYLEIAEIVFKYEHVFTTYTKIATWIEQKHITPYLYMIEKHFVRIKTKVKAELQRV